MTGKRTSALNVVREKTKMQQPLKNDDAEVPIEADSSVFCGASCGLRPAGLCKPERV